MKSSIKLREWSGLDDTTHVGTSYRIATDEAMSNIVDELLNSTTNLTLYNSTVTIPLGTTYYVSIKRHLVTVNGTQVQTEWTTPIPMRNYDNPTGVMVEVDITVDTPFIYIDMDELLDDSKNTFLFKTSGFRSNSEGHSATHYFVYDSVGKLLYSNMNVDDDKTGVVVDKLEVNLYSMSELVFKVIHVTPTGIESPVSTYTATLTTTNVGIASRLSNIVPFTDYTLRLEKVDSSKPMEIRAIDVMSIDEIDVLWSANIIPDKLDYVIPYRILGADSKYLLRVTTTDGTKKVYTKKVMTTIEALGSQRNQPHYVYDNKVKYDSSKDGPILNANTAYTLLNNGKVIAKEPDTNIFKMWTVDVLDYKLSNPITVSGLTTLTNNDDDIYIDVREDGTILIDCLNSLNIPTFLIYKYDSFRNTAVLIDIIVRSTEVKTVGYNNGIVRDTSDVYYYIPQGANYINKLDLSNSTITKIYDINNDSVNNILTRVESGKLAIITGGSDILSYDLKTEEVYNVLTLPIDFRDRPLRLVNLINDDILIAMKDIDFTDREFMLSYDNSRGMLRTIDKVYDGENVNYHTSLLLSTGELVFITNTDNRDQYYIYH